MNRHRERETRPEMSFGEGQRWKEDGNRVTKVKYAGTLVVHWTKPLLRQHRCRRESSGPYGEPEENSLRSYHRSNANPNFFYNFFYLYRKKGKEIRGGKRSGKRAKRRVVRVFHCTIVSFKYLRSRKEKYFLLKKKTKNEILDSFFPCYRFHYLQHVSLEFFLIFLAR